MNMSLVAASKVCRIVSGATPSTTIPEYWNGTTLWMTPTDLGATSSMYIDCTARMISAKGLDSCAAEIIPEGSVIMSSRAPIGHLAIASKPTTTNQGCKSFIPGPELDSEYLYFYLKYRMPAIRALGSGAIFSEVSKSSLESFSIVVPDLSTQRRIAERLKKQMAAVTEARKAVEEQQQSVGPLFEKLLADAFEGVIPLSLGINSDPAPPGWGWHRLLNLARLESGHTPSRKHPEYWENGHIPWLALPDIRALDCQIAMETSERTNDLGIANSSARLLPADTVALSRTASVGFVTLFGRPMATSQDFVNWICGEEIHPKFLMWLLRASRKFIREVSTGAIHKTVYMDVVERFHVCLPSLPAQQAITARLDAAFEQTEGLRVGLEDQMEAVAALPAAYLRAAFEETE
jgi:type I restriction enzyme S subunit